jgi:raffinose/stachyose/melibiose transport system substrate-binding protein
MKLKTMIASQSLPDVYYSKPDQFSVLQENKLIQPITDLLDDDPQFKSKFKDGAFSDFTVDRQIWAIPFQLSSNHVIYYNKKLLKRVGYDSFPTTMEGFIEMGKKLRAAGIVPWVLGNKAGWPAPSCILNTLVYRYCDASWFDSLYHNTGAKFTDACFVNAAKKMKEFVDAGLFNADMNSLTTNDQQSMFNNQQAAMFVEGVWALTPVIQGFSGDLSDVGLAILPPVQGYEKYGNIVAGGAGWGVCLNAQMTDEHKKVAWDFIKKMYNSGYARISAANGGFPAMKVDLDSLDVNPLIAEINKMDVKMAPIFDVQFTGTIVDVYYNDFQSMLLSMITPEEYAEHCENARLSTL